MWRSLFLIVVMLAGSWHFTDLDSGFWLTAIAAPVTLALMLIVLAIWLVLFAGGGRRTSSRDSAGGFFFGDGGDGGC